MSALDARLVVERAGFRLDCALRVEPGEVVALLGPNGAGKSTAVRALAGLLRLDAGGITLGSATWADAAQNLHRPPYERGIGVVFQDYLLLPHLTVLDNVAFGPRSRRLASGPARERARSWLTRVGADDLVSARPRQLSGGQAQRVALARALATEPDLLLLDEPLAALDARTRLLVRGELRRHLTAFAGPTLLVTHDPLEAAVLADRLVVLEEGRIVQTGTAGEVSRRPSTDYVARLVGLNLLSGRAEGHTVVLSDGARVHLAEPATGGVHVAFRPAAVSLFTRRPEGTPRNLWRCEIAGLEPHGEGIRVELRGFPGYVGRLVAEVTSAAVIELDLRLGVEVWASVKASDVDVYPRA